VEKKYKCSKTEAGVAMVSNGGQRENPEVFSFSDLK
jgi:hypothetical protein